MDSHDRFTRQSDLVPRQRLQDLRITLIGIGAIGRQLALQLAALGARRLQLIDFDAVERTNITTQGYLEADLAQPKVEATARCVQQIDSSIEVQTVIDRYRPAHASGDVVFTCVDSIASRTAIWRALRDQSSFFCDGRMLGEVIRVVTAFDALSKDHYASTLFPQSEAQVGTCTSRSTFYAATIAAGLTVHQLTRWLRGLPIDNDLTLNLLASELTIGSMVSSGSQSVHNLLNYD